MPIDAERYGITYDFNSRWSVIERDEHGRVSVVHEEGLTLDDAHRIVKRLRRKAVEKADGK